MPPDGILEPVDVSGDGVFFGLLAGLPGDRPDQLQLDAKTKMLFGNLAKSRDIARAPRIGLERLVRYLRFWMPALPPE
jgi:hypothetical protein